jgi:hypothetical protein
MAALDSLAAATARETARYVDRRVAVADGYRRIGTDFPGMGEHWLHPGALLDGRLDPTRPTLLTYATLDGRPTLLGVGFVVTTAGTTAASVPGWPHVWHEHSGLLADESGAAPHDGAPDATAVGGAPAGAARTRVWVLHAWTRLGNPAGPYAPDNWALPFVRAGLPAPTRTDVDAARACSLVVGGERYLRDVLTDAGLADSSHAAAIDATLAQARATVEPIVARARAAGSVSAAELTALGTTWRTMAAALERALGSKVRPLLAPPHAAPPHATAPRAPGEHAHGAPAAAAP